MIPLLGMEFNNLRLEDILACLLSRPPGTGFAYIVTPNADHIVRLWRTPGLRQIYSGAKLCLLDSRFISNAAGRLGLSTPQVVTGADLTAGLLERMGEARVAVIGMSPEVVEALGRRYPRITFLHHEPPKDLLYRPADFAVARDFAAQAKADFTFLALGSPVQELLAFAISQHRESTGLGFCIGSALEFAAGTAPRAPVWMQSRGLEWLHRLVRDPRRLARRYLLDDPLVLWGLAVAVVRRKGR